MARGLSPAVSAIRLFVPPSCPTEGGKGGATATTITRHARAVPATTRLRGAARPASRRVPPRSLKCEAKGAAPLRSRPARPFRLPPCRHHGKREGGREEAEAALAAAAACLCSAPQVTSLFPVWSEGPLDTTVNAEVNAGARRLRILPPVRPCAAGRNSTGEAPLLRLRTCSLERGSQR